MCHYLSQSAFPHLPHMVDICGAGKTEEKGLLVFVSLFLSRCGSVSVRRDPKYDSSALREREESFKSPISISCSVAEDP